MTIYEKAVAAQSILEHENKTLQEQINSSPAGILYCGRENSPRRDRWYITKDKKRVFLPYSEKELATQLAWKRLNMKKLDDNNRELKAVRAYLRHHKEGPSNAEKLLQNCPALSDLIHSSSPGREWMQESYRKNNAYPEHLKFQAPDGQMVRSKSEAEIITVLIELGIPYRYECAVCDEGFTYYPDFTIRLQNVTKYWEHLGKVDDPVYRKENFRKISWYIDHGIIPQDNLILTYETRNCPFTIVKARNIASFYFS